MSRRYDSFVIRCWRVGGQILQVIVEHVQSGEQARGTRIEDAFDWLALQAGMTLEPEGSPQPPLSTSHGENAAPQTGGNIDEQD